MTLITPSKGSTDRLSVFYVNSGELPVSVHDVQVWAKVSGQDNEIESLIREVVDMAEAEFNLTIIDKTVTAKYDNFGEKVLLPYAPVKAITSVKVNGVAADYTLFGNALKFVTWGGTLEVVYTTGHTNLPEGLKLAIKKAVLSAFEDRQDSVLGGVVGKIPNHSRAIFKRYRNF